MTLTKHPHGCLLFFPRPVWESTATRSPLADVGPRLAAHFPGQCMRCRDGRRGRVLVSPELRTAGGLEKEVMMLGMGTHFEIWDAQTWPRRNRRPSPAACPMLSNFSF